MKNWMKMRLVETARRPRNAPPAGDHPGWFRRRIGEPVFRLLRTGLDPRSLAWSLAAGLALGVYPLPGSTTLLCVAAAHVFGLNLPAMQLANYSAYPLQLALLIPFLRLGARLFRAAPIAHSLPTLIAAIKANPTGTLLHMGSMFWHATLVWALLALPVMVLLAFLLRPPLEAAARRLGRNLDTRRNP